ncbi:glycoside hydrolase family 27 protein [Caulobacter hibisci]|uniref:Alpha-galactosidase n=1 Tax=Caulobacter hibisci TaxID=2035993 RepID=A0ABS0SYU5_9CAUL|nr:glycoside hydrolase family 27 protein [Caulobacter hibisci]MBI1683782.1 glycoside hydrolase family 27 protein [Caulobacter hibisci]
MRRLLTPLALGLVASHAAIAAPAAQPKLAGVWAFDSAPSYPGVTLMKIENKAGKPTGTVTTAWYGAMDMQNLVVKDGVATFELRNLNDKDRPTRQWTATVKDGGVSLVGDIWYAHVEQQGRPGTAADAKARAFTTTSLPPMGQLATDGLAAKPPMGWSSWNKFGAEIDDKTVRAMADAIVAFGLRDAGYVYVNIDDGWQGERGADGVLRPNAKFPDMKALADYVHSKGLKLGIYSSPGPKTCAGYAGSYGHVAQDAKTFAEWGVDYLKYDLCSGEWFYADADTVQRTYYEMGAALRATGRPIVYSLCQYGRFDVGAWGRQVGGHLWRTTGDITDDYPTMARIGFDKNGKAELAGPGGWNDPDMLEVGNGGMTKDEYLTHMSLWAMSAAPLMMGHDLRDTGVEVLKILENREVIAVDQDARGVQGKAVRKDGATEVWNKPLADGSVAVALFNRGDKAARMELKAADAGASGLAGVRDLWRGVDLPAGEQAFDVPARGVVMVRVKGG